MFALLTMTAIPMAFVMMVLAIVKVIGMSNQIVQVTFIMIGSDLVMHLFPTIHISILVPGKHQVMQNSHK